MTFDVRNGEKILVEEAAVATESSAPEIGSQQKKSPRKAFFTGS